MSDEGIGGSSSSNESGVSKNDEELVGLEDISCAADISLATIPGKNFNPAKRSFSIDELKPQPIIKKRRKVSTGLVKKYSSTTSKPF